MIRKSTRWDRKERVNVESGLNIIGTKHFTITGAPAYTHFACFIQPNLQTGLFIGTQTIASLSLVSGVWNFITGTATGTQIGGNGDEDYLISNLVLFDSAQSYEENEFIRVQGGLLRETSHIDCVAHYSLTQRQYQKASAAFIIKHPQFALNDLVALDEVEQYNYAKAIPLAANHGKLVNFTDTEAGVDGLAPIGTSIKDFHKKTALDVYEAPVQPLPIDNIEKKSQFVPFVNALRFVGANNHRLEQNVINIDSGADFYTFMIVHKMVDGENYNSADDTFYYAHDGSPTNLLRIGGRQPIGFQASIVEAGTGKAHLWLGTPTPPDELQVSFVVVNQSLAQAGNSGAERYISNGNEIISGGSSATAKIRFDLYTKVVYGNNAFGGASASYDGYLVAIGIWNRALSMKEMKRLTNNTLLMNPDESIKKGLQQYNLFNNKTANGIEDLSGNGNHIDAFINYSVNELDPNHVDYKFIDIDELR